jgi:pyrimidine deaminase RibD-like protein
MVDIRRSHAPAPVGRSVGAAPRSGDSVDVVARTYHTENGVEHAEGDAYAVTDRALAETLRAIGFVAIEGWTEDGGGGPAAPVVASLTPSTAVAGGAAFTLAVAGTGFVDGDAVTWNGAAVATTFVSATALSAAIDAPAVATPGDVPVAVGASNALPFTVTAAR